MNKIRMIKQMNKIRMTKLDKDIRVRIHEIADRYFNPSNMQTEYYCNEYHIKIKVIKKGGKKRMKWEEILEIQTKEVREEAVTMPKVQDLQVG